MQKVRVPITNFQFGEISPSLSSRTDSDVYTASAERIENLFLRAEGGVVKRNGLLNHHKFTEAVAITSTGFIYVVNYATIAVGSVINISDVDGTLYVLQAEAQLTGTDADPDGISVSAQVANQTNLVLAGALASGGSVTLTVPRLVTITSVGNDTGFAFTVTGTDADGTAQTEAITGGNNSTKTGEKFFKTITQITPAGDPANTVTAGVAAGSIASSPIGNTYFYRAFGSHAETSLSIGRAINEMPFLNDINVSSSVSGITTFSRKSPLSKNLGIFTNSMGITVSNFLTRAETKPKIKLFPFIFSDDEEYIVALIEGKYTIAAEYSFRIFKKGTQTINSVVVDFFSSVATVTGMVKINSATISAAAEVGNNANLVIGGSLNPNPAADPDGISVSASVGDGDNLVLGGALASGGAVTFYNARKVTITSAGNDGSFDFNVTGTDVNNAAQTEAIIGANAGIATGSKFFQTITQIEAAGNPAGAVTAGVTVRNEVTFADGYARKISITSAGNDSAISFTITGTKANGISGTETITGANAGTAYGVDLWQSITQITAVGDPAGTVSVGNHEIELPFNVDYFNELTFTQKGDVMFICHPLFMPLQLVRTSLQTFRAESFLFDSQSDVQKIYQPYFSFQGQGVTLDPAATSGTDIVLTTSSGYWDTTGSATAGDYLNSLHLGTTLRYHGTEIEITSVQSSTLAKGTIFGTLSQVLDLNAFRTTSGSTNVEVTHAAHGLFKDDSLVISNAAAVGNIASSNLNGTRVITSIIDVNHYTFTAGGSANATTDGGGAPTIATHAPSSNWSEQSFSALRGFPAATTFHENRLVFAGTISQPDSIFMSKSSQYYNFDVGNAEDNDSIQITANVGEVNEIRHLVSNRNLQIFTAASEMYIPSFQNKPLTPTTVSIQKQTPYGAGYAKPQIMDGSTVFVQNGGKIIREYLFTDSEQAYNSSPLSTLSQHLIKSPVELNVLNAASDRAEDYIFSLNEDDTVSVFNSNRAEKRAGWVEFTSQNPFISMATISGRVFAVMQSIAGNYHLCEFSNTVNTDISKLYTGTSGVFDVSADYSNGDVLSVINGNSYLGDFTVASGDIDVSAVSTLTTAEIGLKYEVNLITNPIDLVAQNGPLTGDFRGISNVIVDLNSTLSASVNGINLLITNVTDDLSLIRQPFTGKKEFRLLGYSRDPKITISQSSPLPLQINGLIAELVF